jgi:hypothetical protein
MSQGQHFWRTAPKKRRKRRNPHKGKAAGKKKNWV